MKVWYLEYEDLAAVFDSLKKALAFFENYISKQKDHKFHISSGKEYYLELTVSWPETYLTYDNMYTGDFKWDTTIRKATAYLHAFEVNKPNSNWEMEEEG